MTKAEKKSGVTYEEARKEHDDIVGAGFGEHGEDTGAQRGQRNQLYDEYQQAAAEISNAVEKYDSVSACYMLNGPRLSSIPWTGSPESEIDAFVTEELYIHTKLLIADDRVVICGSANLNDRSQLGDHDSEIAIVIEDSALVDSTMDGRPYKAAKYAASLRRQLMRKHAGLLKYKDCTKPDSNFQPINKDPNVYDWGSAEDLLVQDIFAHDFIRLWDSRAANNTQVFRKASHAVPDDGVRNWKEYDEFYGRYFVGGKDDEKKTPMYEYGHVVKENFGDCREVKGLLDTVRGTLVEMPLSFMGGVDFAKEGLTFNAFTDEVYT